MYEVVRPASSRSPLDAGQNGSDVICRTPAVLEDIQAELARGVDIWMEHLADELDRGGLVGILLLEVHDQPKGAVLEWCVDGSDNDGVPVARSVTNNIRREWLRSESHHVMTLSGTGEAETPAGGSVCMRCRHSRQQSRRLP